jgi:hypothetical protein
MPPSGMLGHVAFIRTDGSEEHITFIVRVTRISKLGTTLAVTSNRSMLYRKKKLFSNCDDSIASTKEHSY